jgi:hypothetical protein
LSEPDQKPSWDVFVSYASEDRDSVAEPLARKLTECGLAVWYDRTELKIGDRLRESIDRGLALSRFGIVVLSPSFFAKHYPQRELDGLAQREVDGTKVILPVWHLMGESEIRTYSPPLADRIAGRWDIGIDTVVQQITAVIQPEAAVSLKNSRLASMHAGLEREIEPSSRVELATDNKNASSASGKAEKLNHLLSNIWYHGGRPICWLASWFLASASSGWSSMLASQLAGGMRADLKPLILILEYSLFQSLGIVLPAVLQWLVILLFFGRTLSILKSTLWIAVALVCGMAYGYAIWTFESLDWHLCHTILPLLALHIGRVVTFSDQRNFADFRYTWRSLLLIVPPILVLSSLRAETVGLCAIFMAPAVLLLGSLPKAPNKTPVRGSLSI